MTLLKITFSPYTNPALQFAQDSLKERGQIILDLYRDRFPEGPIPPGPIEIQVEVDPIPDGPEEKSYFDRYLSRYSGVYQLHFSFRPDRRSDQPMVVGSVELWRRTQSAAESVVFVSNLTVRREVGVPWEEVAFNRGILLVYESFLREVGVKVKAKQPLSPAMIIFGREMDSGPKADAVPRLLFYCLVAGFLFPILINACFPRSS